jgi:hypothetical protein
MALTWPGAKAQQHVKFVSDVLQSIAIIFTILWAAYTFYDQVRQQNAATVRELRRPYDEKQLDLYLDAARTVAHLAVIPPGSDQAVEARFWELYWGELALVESRAPDPNSIEARMVGFCVQYFGTERCHSAGDAKRKAAICLAHLASDEIRDRWTGEKATPCELD